MIIYYNDFFSKILIIKNYNPEKFIFFGLLFYND